MRRMKLRSGNQMVAEGAIASGCRFFAGYPITPASGIYKSMIEFLQQRGDVAISAPDEISALAYCVGASMRGFKAMTATSGPGWALMIETFQYALMTETPLVIPLVQRLGPSTGGATQGAQGDILLAEFCTSGGYTIPIFCPSTARECYDLTIHSFRWAEILRCPVILLLDKEVGMTTESVDFSLLNTPQISERYTVSGQDAGVDYPIKTYEFADVGEVPPFIPVGGDIKVTATGSAHNKSGKLKKNDPETLEVLYHLEEKIRSRSREMAVVDSDLEYGASTLVISFGITARTMRQAITVARGNGKKASALNMQTLFPVPTHALTTSAEGVSRIVVAEENMQGQYCSVIQHLFPSHQIVKVNAVGRMITPQEIVDAIL